MRRELTPQRAVELLCEYYAPDHVTSRGNLPVFYAPEAGMFKLLSDLYIARDIYLSRRNDQYAITDLRLPELEHAQPQFDEIVTHYARTLNRLLSGPGKLIYRIDRALPKLAHTPNLVGMRQLSVPIAARYDELFCK